jgi:NADPH:quinone reductase-like Zn-dependent oxidoreductase
MLDPPAGFGGSFAVNRYCTPRTWCGVPRPPPAVKGRCISKKSGDVKVVVQDRYGSPEVLRVEEVDRPAPKDDEILIRVRAATVSQTDTHVRAAHPFFWRLIGGFRRPRWRTLGVDLAGEVEAVGSAVTELKVGDAVFGSPSSFFGSHAEYVCSRTGRALALMPAAMSFEEAAAVYDGGSQALSALRHGEAQPGRRILI